VFLFFWQFIYYLYRDFIISFEQITIGNNLIFIIKIQ